MLRRSILFVALVVMAACATGPAGRIELGNDEPNPRTSSVKTITIGQLNPIKSYGPWEFSTTAGGGASLAEVHTVGLVSEDRDGNLDPRLAARLPSLDDGTIAI